MEASSGKRTTRSISVAMVTAVYQSTSKPSSARWMAGSITCSRGREPYLSWARQNPATVPGTLMDL